jgi:hypothetical protein
LKKNGLIILTFDYPGINLEYLNKIVNKAELKFAGPVDFKFPKDALYFEKKDLYFLKTILRPKN